MAKLGGGFRCEHIALSMVLCPLKLLGFGQRKQHIFSMYLSFQVRSIPRTDKKTQFFEEYSSLQG